MVGSGPSAYLVRGSAGGWRDEVAPVVPVVTSKVTGMGRQVLKSRLVRDEHVAAFPLRSPKTSRPAESALRS